MSSLLDRGLTWSATHSTVTVDSPRTLVELFYAHGRDGDSWSARAVLAHAAEYVRAHAAEQGLEPDHVVVDVSIEDLADELYLSAEHYA